ncbi:MAG: recombinase zinc beta ribbon domain-containing protein, partial [Xenococcaceae cyanobacterium]
FGSLRGAVRYLEKRYGKKISVSTGRSWLTNPVYRGQIAYGNGEIVSDTHSSIISSEEAAQIDRLLRRNLRLPSRTASAPRSLAGLVICQECQSAMTITRVTRKNKQQEYLYLRPINCQRSNKCKAIAYEEVLNRAIERICQDLPVAVAQLNMPNIDSIKNNLLQEIERRKKILEQLPILKEQGILDEETANLRSYKLRTEIAELENKIAQLPPVNLRSIAKDVSISQFWLDLSETERRFYFREFIRYIEIIRERSKDWNLKLLFIF